MKKLLITLLLACAFSSAEAAYVLKNGKFVNSKDLPTYSPEEHYRLACAAYEAEDYAVAAEQFNIIAVNFPNAPFYHDSLFFLGVSYYNDAEYDFANESFSQYLNCQSNPQYFEEAFSFKLDIAAQFACGAKKRFFGTKLLPKWAPSGSLPIEIYDEVVAALPCHPFAAYALYCKSSLYWKACDYRNAIDSLQQLIRRFPKDELAPTAYVCIGELYLQLCAEEINNPDLLALAEINCKRFSMDFPKEERICEVESCVQEMKELYAKGLFDTAQFYERIEQPCASVLYYRSTIEQFPDTSYAQCSRVRLEILTGEV